MQIHPAVLYGFVAVVIVAVLAWGILTIKRRGVADDVPYDTVDKVLWALTIPLLAVVAVGAVIGISSVKKSKKADVTPPDEPDEPEESRSDQVIRIVDHRAEEVEDHVLHDATDDEVAARGAGLFDPDTPTDPDAA